jgi:uncharacterized protein
MGQMQLINVPNQKGEKIAVVVHRPEKLTGKLAILCPGFLDAKDYYHLVELAKRLAEHGYTVARFDPTGTWDSEGDISDYTMTQYLEDIRCVLEYMLATGNFRHILLGGHSRGGQMSVLYAARDPRVTFALCIMGSSGPIKGPRRDEWEKTGVSVSQRRVPGTTGESKEYREYRVPFSHVLDRDQYDAVADAKKIHVPIVFVAGELDDQVPPELVKKIFDNANEPKQFIVIPSVGHDYRRNPSEIETVNSVILKALSI